MEIMSTFQATACYVYSFNLQKVVIVEMHITIIYILDFSSMPIISGFAMSFTLYWCCFAELQEHKCLSSYKKKKKKKKNHNQIRPYHALPFLQVTRHYLQHPT